MGKRVRREKSVCTCISPRPSFLAPHSAFCCYEEDVWTAITKFLGGRSLVMLALANKWFYRLIMDDSIWRFACLRDLQVPEPKQQVLFKWKQLYASAFDGSHSYTFQQREKHIGLPSFQLLCICMKFYVCQKNKWHMNMTCTKYNEIGKSCSDWMRIGAFSMESSEALLTEKLSPCPSMAMVTGKNTEKMKSVGSFLLKNVKTGVWIADLQLVRCPVCDLNTCEGTMQTLDARHIELFLDKEYQGGSWEYQQIGARDVKENMSGASGAIFDMKHLNDTSTLAIFDIKSWTGDPDDWQPKAMITLHAVAVNTNLQKNEGLHVKYQIMREGNAGEIVSIRISQQLL